MSSLFFFFSFFKVFFYYLYVSFNHAIGLRVVGTGSYMIYVPLFGKCLKLS